jgi:hypothetical protein
MVDMSEPSPCRTRTYADRVPSEAEACYVVVPIALTEDRVTHSSAIAVADIRRLRRDQNHRYVVAQVAQLRPPAAQPK